MAKKKKKKILIDHSDNINNDYKLMGDKGSVLNN
jgi:hypothetical protein